MAVSPGFTAFSIPFAACSESGSPAFSLAASYNFQMGNPFWKQWNEALKKTLLPNQCKGGPLDGSANDKDGSWDLLCRADKAGGRVYTTAVGALCLEVYYRYLPMYTR